MIFNKTENGRVFRCKQCNKIHLEFNNININFLDQEKYTEFASHIHSIDLDYCEQISEGSPSRKNIVIPLGMGSCNFILNMDDLRKLKSLCRQNLFSSWDWVVNLNMDYSLN